MYSLLLAGIALQHFALTGTKFQSAGLPCSNQGGFCVILNVFPVFYYFNWNTGLGSLFAIPSPKQQS